MELFTLDKDDRSPYFEFFVRLNHSHLITSRSEWHPNVLNEFEQMADKTAEDLSSEFYQWINSFLLTSISEAGGSYLTIWDDMYTVLETAIVNFDAEIQLLLVDVDLMKKHVIEGYHANAFLIKPIVEIGGSVARDLFKSYGKDFAVKLEKALDRFFMQFNGQPDSFSKTMAKLRDKYAWLSQLISQWFGSLSQGSRFTWPSARISRIWDDLIDIFNQVAREYDKVVLFFYSFF